VSVRRDTLTVRHRSVCLSAGGDSPPTQHPRARVTPSPRAGWARARWMAARRPAKEDECTAVDPPEDRQRLEATRFSHGGTKQLMPSRLRRSASVRQASQRMLIPNCPADSPRLCLGLTGQASEWRGDTREGRHVRGGRLRAAAGSLRSASSHACSRVTGQSHHSLQREIYTQFFLLCFFLRSIVRSIDRSI
jgi:hypothetical protein